MKWPHPDALKDLVVEETDKGFVFSAPEGTECGDWLTYYSETKERRKQFKKMIMKAINTFCKNNP